MIQFYENKPTSILDTTPLVTEMVSPPSGYPTTVTASCQLRVKQLKRFNRRHVCSIGQQLTFPPAHILHTAYLFVNFRVVNDTA